MNSGRRGVRSVGPLFPGPLYRRVREPTDVRRSPPLLIRVLNSVIEIFPFPSI